MLLKMQSSRAWANIVDVGSTAKKSVGNMLVPLTPEAFQAKLQKVTFTNGADKEVVAALYRRTIEDALSHTQELRFVKQGWRDTDITRLVDVLPFCSELRRLALDDNTALSAKGAETLARALTEGVASKLTHLGHEAGRAFAQNTALRAACEARGIQLTRFAGIKSDEPQSPSSRPLRRNLSRNLSGNLDLSPRSLSRRRVESRGGGCVSTDSVSATSAAVNIEIP